MHPLDITGVGVVTPLGVGIDAFVAGLREGRDGFTTSPDTFDAKPYEGACVGEVRGFEPGKYLGDKGLRTLDRLTKLLLVATRLAAVDAGIKKDGQYLSLSPHRVGLCASTAYGSLEAITELDRVAVLEDARYLNPAKFPNTVINSAAGYASIWEDLRALNVTVSNGNTGPLDAILCAGMYLGAGAADAILVGGAEALSEALYLAFRRLGVLREQHGGANGIRLGEGAALFALQPPEVAAVRGARRVARIVGYGTSFEPPESEVLMVHPSSVAIGQAIRAALDDAGWDASSVDLVVSSASGLPDFDRAERTSIDAVIGTEVPIAAPKLVLGESLGAASALGLASGLAWIGALSDGGPIPLGPASLRGETRAEAERVICTAVGFYGTAAAVAFTRGTS